MFCVQPNIQYLPRGKRVTIFFATLHPSPDPLSSCQNLDWQLLSFDRCPLAVQPSGKRQGLVKLLMQLIEKENKMPQGKVAIGAGGGNRPGKVIAKMSITRECSRTFFAKSVLDPSRRRRHWFQFSRRAKSTFTFSLTEGKKVFPGVRKE